MGLWERLVSGSERRNARVRAARRSNPTFVPRAASRGLLVAAVLVGIAYLLPALLR